MAIGLLLCVSVTLTLCVEVTLPLSVPVTQAVADCVVLVEAEAHSEAELQPENEVEAVEDKDVVRVTLCVAEGVASCVVGTGERLTVPEPQAVDEVEAEDDWLCDSVALGEALAHTVCV